MKRSERKAATEAAIISAATTAFKTLGYERATIRDIANIAGLSTGAVYANWEGKEHLYATVFGHYPVTAKEILAELKRLRDVAKTFIAEHSDPGTEALAAVYCADQLIAKVDRAA